MARREEKVDAELLARLESGGGDKIRVPLPNRKVNEMFAISVPVNSSIRLLIRPFVPISLLRILLV